MVTFNEETYIALTDLAKLRCASEILRRVFNQEGVADAVKSVNKEIDRLEGIVDAASNGGTE